MKLITEEFFQKCEDALIRCLTLGVREGKITLIEGIIVVNSFRLGKDALIKKYTLEVKP